MCDDARDGVEVAVVNSIGFSGCNDEDIVFL
jgi:hypothetical protein